jgi:hypothetical protein
MWKEVSKETFERFVQFAYTGDYSIPDTRECIKVAEPWKEDIDVSKAFESRPAEEKLTEGMIPSTSCNLVGQRAKRPRRTVKRARALGKVIVAGEQRLQSRCQSQSLIHGLIRG